MKQTTPETDDLARGNHVVPTEWAQQLERERDKAREDAQKSKAYKRVLKVTNENLKRERDEAREELYDIRLNLGEDAEGYTLLHAVCVLQNKRDEAIAALMRIEDLFLDGTDIYADRENMGLIARSALEDTKKQLQGIDKGI